MTVIAFVGSEPRLVAAPASGDSAGAATAEARLRLYGRVVSVCFIVVLASWVAAQIGCLLSLFLHFRSGIVVGTIDGTIAFDVAPAIDILDPLRTASHGFSPKVFPTGVSIAFAVILIVASAPFCASLAFLARLFALYARGEVFTGRNARIVRRLGHCVLATGYSPLLLGPIAHLIGVLRPVTGVSRAMIACVLLGLVLLAISHVMTMGERLQQDQEAIL